MGGSREHGADPRQFSTAAAPAPSWSPSSQEEAEEGAQKRTTFRRWADPPIVWPRPSFFPPTVAWDSCPREEARASERSRMVHSQCGPSSPEFKEISSSSGGGCDGTECRCPLLPFVCVGVLA